MTTIVSNNNATELTTLDDELVSDSNNTDSATTLKPVKVTTHTVKKSSKKSNKDAKEVTEKSKKSKKMIATSTEIPDSTENPDETVDFDDSNVEDEKLLPPMTAARGRGYSSYALRKYPMLNRRNYWSSSNPGNWRSNDERNENDRLAAFRTGARDPAPIKNPNDAIINNVSN